YQIFCSTIRSENYSQNRTNLGTRVTIQQKEHGKNSMHRARTTSKHVLLQLCQRRRHGRSPEGNSLEQAGRILRNLMDGYSIDMYSQNDLAHAAEMGWSELIRRIVLRKESQ